MSATYRFLFTFTLLAALTAARPALATSMGVTSNLVEPGGWSVGDANSTHQSWDVKTANTGNLPDVSYNVAGASLTDPTHSVASPGFITGTSNYYAFSGDYGATADIYNHGGSSTGMGTHVIVQIGSSVNPDEESFPGHGTSAFLDSIHLTDLADVALTGGANIEALRIDEVLYQSGVSSSFGEVDYQELIVEFWLPEYTGDFRVAFDQKVHTSLDSLRVDSMIVAAAQGGGSPFANTAVPEPSSLVLASLAGLGLVGFGWRRRRNK